MIRPSRLDILKYALEGACTTRGTLLPSDQDEEFLDQLDYDIDWLMAEIARVEARQLSDLTGPG